jgi:hypothetical protein
VPDPHIFKRSPVLVGENLIQLVERIKSFHDTPKDCMPSIQILDSVGECHEELATTAPFLHPFDGRRDGHRHGAFFGVLKPRNDFGFKVTEGGVRL